MNYSFGINNNQNSIYKPYNSTGFSLLNNQPTTGFSLFNNNQHAFNTQPIIQTDPNIVLQQLKQTHPEFPLFVTKFESPFFYLANHVLFQNKRYIVRGRKDHTQISVLDFSTKLIPSVPLTTFQDTDIMIQAV